jgi:hypothetical protein
MANNIIDNDKITTMFWDKLTHNFGNVKPSQHLTTTFTYNGKAKIKRVVAACGCTLVNYTKGSNSIPVEYTAPAQFPPHLAAEGITEQAIAKSITVTFDDNAEQILIIKATLTK